MEDMATPQPITLAHLGKTYSSYFRPDHVKVLAITTNWDRPKRERVKRGNRHMGLYTYLFLVQYM